MVYVGSSLSAYGFRLLGALVRQQIPDTVLRFVLSSNARSLLNFLIPKKTVGSALTDEEVDTIAVDLSSDTDVLALSAMSEFAEPVKRIIAAVRKRNPSVYIVWGGVHAIMHPEDAIEHADAICVNEGETAFPEFLQKFREGENYRTVKNFWFRDKDQTIKNEYAPLLSSEELDALPLPVYGEHELIYKKREGFVPIRSRDYRAFEALSYNTVWSRGCPFLCSYCGNTKFLEVDAAFGDLRHASVDHVINEIRAAMQKFPHISSIAFHDDCFMGLPEKDLRSFANQMRDRIGLPFTVHGVTPAHIREDKLKILVDAGMNRVRMGVQSGSDRMLKFYKRPNRAGLIMDAMNILGEFSGKMMPPMYDMIFDNPVETREDINDTLRLINEMPRPFILNIFSLRHIPNTELGRQLAEMGTEAEGIENCYFRLKPTYANAVMYLVALVKIPKPLLNVLLRYTRPYRESAQVFRPLIVLLQFLYAAKRAWYHFKWRDFSIAFDGLGLLLSRFKLMKSRLLGRVSH